MKTNLFYPEGYLGSEESRTGRCGPGRGILEKLVPDTIYFLNITPACKIHDYMYRVGGK